MYLNDRAVVNAEVGDVDFSDYPEFCDAYFTYAEYEDGTILSDAELDQLTEKYPDVINEMAMDCCYGAAEALYETDR